MPALLRLAPRDTIRLIPTGRLKPSVLLPLTRNHGELMDIQALEMATSARLMEQQMPTVDELVFDRPNHSLINAAFCYPRPNGSRFNPGSRGAWYAGFTAETAVQEVSFHLTRELAAIDRYDNRTDYAELLADFEAPFHDLRDADPATHACLHADPAIGYPAGQGLALAVRQAGGTGIIYPSVRHAGGTCLACFVPRDVANVRQGGVWHLEWQGDPTPLVSRQR